MDITRALCLVVADRMRKLRQDNKPFMTRMKNGLQTLSKMENRLRELGERPSGPMMIGEQAGFTRLELEDALIRLKPVLYELDDVLDEWDLPIHLREHVMPPSIKNDYAPDWYIIILTRLVCSSIPPATRGSAHVTRKMIMLLAKLDLILEEEPIRTMFPTIIFHSGTSRNPVRICGREVDREMLLREIVVEGNREVQSRSQIISIVGLAGIGKTTLAELLYNDGQLKDSYPLRIWIDVSQYRNNLVSLARYITNKAGWKDHFPEVSDVETILPSLRASLLGKKYFLVLDDAWERDHYMCAFLKECLDFGGDGSTILVTTRNEMVATMMGSRVMYCLRQLSDESCWSILSGIALSRDQHDKFRNLGMEIAKKCNGIPNTAVALGKVLRESRSLEAWRDVMKKQMWEFNDLSEDIFGRLLSTYRSLLPAIRCCFSYCGIIPKGSEVYSKKLLRCWSAQDYLRALGGGGRDSQDYLTELAKHSLFQEVVKDEFDRIILCKLYDIVLDCGQFLRKNAVNDIIGATCQDCGTSLLSHVEEYRSLFFQGDAPTYICDCLKGLRVLSLRDCGLERIPADMVKLIHLRFLDMSYNQGLCEEDLKIVCKLYHLETLFLSSCGLHRIPMEIGDLLQLSHLDLSFNRCLTDLPESICNLLELRTLELDECDSLSELPQGIHGLKNLTHLHNLHTNHYCPQGLGKLTSLRTLNGFSGKLSLLKGLDQLSGSLQLRIPESCGLEDVAEAKEAHLYRKVGIQELDILFGEEADEAISLGVLDGLQPHSDVRYVKIELYGGSKLPGWIVSPFIYVRQIELQQCNGLLSLPALGKLPLLEELTMQEMDGLQCVGREFLGLTTGTGDQDIASSSSSVSAITFPELKVLTFYECPNWVVWEDITAEEEESTNEIMPRLKNLDVVACGGLVVLPHRLLRKMVALEELDSYDSSQLIEVYEDKEGADWHYISHIPKVRFD